MFKKFDDTCVSGTTQLKSSSQRTIKQKICEQFPPIEKFMDDIMPKKDAIKIVKCQQHIELLVNGQGDYLFFRQRDETWMPALKLIHKYPMICPTMQVDAGAIKFVLRGANVMCPGLTSKGAVMTPNLSRDAVVTIIAEGKEHALGVGVLKLSSEEIVKLNEGIAIETMHFLNDGLWRLKPAK